MLCTVAQGLIEKGRKEQFQKDIINNIKMLKELNIHENRIIELISESYEKVKECT